MSIDSTSDPGPQRPVPVPSAETAPYWEAAKSGVLSLPRCAACGTLSLPPRATCPTCQGPQDWVVLSGHATLRGATTIHIAALPGHSGQLTVVEAALTEDPTTILIANDPTGTCANLPPDAPLRLTMTPDSNGWSYPTAHPSESTL